MADERACRLCLHEYTWAEERAHIDLFVRGAGRITKLDTFEISADFAPELAAYLGAGHSADASGPSRSAVRLRILQGPEPASEAGIAAPGPQSGLARRWRAERKADHRLQYWRHTGPIEGLDASGRDRGHLQELARGILVGRWPAEGGVGVSPESGSPAGAPDSGFWFTLEPRDGA